MAPENFNMVKISKQTWATNSQSYSITTGCCVKRVHFFQSPCQRLQSRQKFCWWYWWYNVRLQFQSRNRLTINRQPVHYLLSWSDKRSNCCSKAREYRQKTTVLFQKFSNITIKYILNVVATIFKAGLPHSARLVLSIRTLFQSDLSGERFFLLPPTWDHSVGMSELLVLFPLMPLLWGFPDWSGS